VSLSWSERTALLNLHQCWNKMVSALQLVNLGDSWVDKQFPHELSESWPEANRTLFSEWKRVFLRIFALCSQRCQAFQLGRPLRFSQLCETARRHRWPSARVWHACVTVGLSVCEHHRRCPCAAGPLLPAGFLLRMREYSLLVHKEVSTVLQIAHSSGNSSDGSRVCKRNTSTLGGNFQVIAQSIRSDQNVFSQVFQIEDSKQI